MDGHPAALSAGLGTPEAAPLSVASKLPNTLRPVGVGEGGRITWRRRAVPWRSLDIRLLGVAAIVQPS
jgi:hypothetical protein